jgi:RNA recognition motif-containing protein
LARNRYSAGKRQRENDKQKKKRDKMERRRTNQSGGTDGIPIATVEELQGVGLASPEEVVEALQAGGTAGAPVRSAGVPMRLFVGGLSWDTSELQLQELFEAHGSVQEAVIVKDRDTGDSRGFGFVTMADRRDAAKAIREVNGMEFDRRTLVVKQATERKR